jgi:hypothetical protein
MRKDYIRKNEYLLLVRGLKFVLTCRMCPEQYDVFDKNNVKIGYVHLRHGHLRCDYPDVGEKTIYSHDMGDDAVAFKDNNEQYLYLNKIAKRIKREILNNQIMASFKRYLSIIRGKIRCTYNKL